jgi:hypothetical protein
MVRNIEVVLQSDRQRCSLNIFKSAFNPTSPLRYVLKVSKGYFEVECQVAKALTYSDAICCQHVLLQLVHTKRTTRIALGPWEHTSLSSHRPHDERQARYAQRDSDASRAEKRPALLTIPIQPNPGPRQPNQ